MSEVVFEAQVESEDEFWQRFKEHCKKQGWEIYDVSDMETVWYALPSAATNGHGIGVQEIIVRDKSGREITLARIRENYYGSITEKVKVIAEEVGE